MTGADWGGYTRQGVADVGPALLKLLAFAIVGALLGLAYVGIREGADWAGYLVAAVGGAAFGHLMESRHPAHIGPYAR